MRICLKKLITMMDLQLDRPQRSPKNFNNAKNLKIVGRAGIGTDNIDKLLQLKMA